MRKMSAHHHRSGLLLLVVYWLLCWPSRLRASEFPERECCDPIYPVPEPTSKIPKLPSPTGKSESDKTVAILNCMYARQLCFEHPSCAAILEIIPRVCGPEIVACSTVTVTKCQVALRSLQAFEFFKPTCLCREPHVDPECNSFRDFLFDHPCIYAAKKEKDPNAIETLPLCTHALSNCQRDGCIEQYDNYKKNCKTRDGRCRMENRDACHEAWTQLRLSPMFGCICPENSGKKRCDKIFSMVNHNPCVEDPSSESVDLSGMDSSLHPYGGEPPPQVGSMDNLQQLWIPPTSTYPYFLYPRGTSGPKLSSAYYELDRDLASSLEQDHLDQWSTDADDQDDGDGVKKKRPGVGRPKIFLYPESFTPVLQDPVSPRPVRVFENDRWHTQWLHVRRTDPSKSSQTAQHDRQPHNPSTSTTFTLEHNSQHESTKHRHRHNHQHQHQHQAPASSNGTGFTDVYQRRLDDFWIMPSLNVERLDKLREALDGFLDPVNVISNSDNTTTLELIESQLENPLIDPDHQDLHALKQLPIPNIQLPHHHRFHHKQRNQSHDDHEGNLVAPSSLPDNERIAQQPVKVILTSTCHHAYSTCNNDAECRALVQPVLSHCDHSKCKRNECMKALQQFYKMANSKHSMDIGFCLCKKSEGSKRDDCSKAKELMHPSCALRVPQGAETPSCDALADNCRKDPSCRSKLELYEQSCSVDSVTKKCAGPPLGCRKAMLGILGTELRSNCACRSTDLKLYYECLGWQRLLWVNPCVVEAQKDFHAWRNKHHGHPKPPPSNELRPTTPAPSPTQESYSPEPTQPTPIRRPSSWPSVVTPKASLVAATSFGLAEQEEIVEEQEVAQEIEEEDNVIPEIMTVGKLEPITDPPTSATEPETERITTEKMTTTTTTTTTSTTPAPTTPSTPPPRFCVVQRAHQSHQYIRVGKGKRLYSQSEPDCSELCQCGEGEVLTCNTICVESLPCKTDFAFYNHAAPAYQAFRGRCLCYSGRFICMRPSPETYNIPHGVFMFLGYSETDENLLKPHNNLTVVDAVSSLDNFMREEVNNKTVCTLFLYNLTKENVIAVARLVTDNTLSTNLTQAQTLKHLVRIKEECASMMQNLSEKINNRHQEVHTHPLLSIFKMAEVEIKLPKASSASRLSSRPCGTSIIVVAISIIFSVSTFSS